MTDLTGAKHRRLKVGDAEKTGGSESLCHRLPSVSVIIPTKNRPSDLAATVESLLQQSLAPAQLIVIDQSDDDESRRIVEGRYAHLPMQIKSMVDLCYFHDPRISGLTEGRNQGMALARGEILLFLDDDVYLEPNFLEEVLAVYEQFPQVAAVSGIITNYYPPHWSFRLWTWVFAWGPFHDERQPIYWQADKLRGSDPIRVSKLGGGLMSFRAEVVRGLRFDDRLSGVPEGEELEFCGRLRHGSILVIAPRARLVHKKSPEARTPEDWLRRYIFAQNYLYRRIWKRNWKHRVYFAWLSLGCALLALLAVLRRRSLEPCRSLIAGVREGRAAAG